MLPSLGSAPKEEVVDVKLFCSRVLFQPTVLAKGNL